MTAQKGRNMLLKIGTAASGVTVAGLTATALKLDNEMVDVTTKDSAGWRTLLQQAGVQSITLTANGRADDAASFATLQGYAQAGSINAMGMVYLNGDTLDCNFQVTSFEVAGDYNKEQTFSVTLESSGPPTFNNA